MKIPAALQRLRHAPQQRGEVSETLGHQMAHHRLAVGVERRLRQGGQEAADKYRYPAQYGEADAGKQLAERLCRSFAAEVIPTSAGESIRCTVSIGIARYIPGETRDSLIRRADDAGYEAKRQGKNCAVLAG